jgi:hypothetical protein
VVAVEGWFMTRIDVCTACHRPFYVKIAGGRDRSKPEDHPANLRARPAQLTTASHAFWAVIRDRSARPRKGASVKLGRKSKLTDRGFPHLGASIQSGNAGWGRINGRKSVGHDCPQLIWDRKKIFQR